MLKGNPFVKGDHVRLDVKKVKARTDSGVRTGKVMRVEGDKCSVYWDQLRSRTMVNFLNLRFKIDE